MPQEGHKSAIADSVVHPELVEDLELKCIPPIRVSADGSYDHLYDSSNGSDSPASTYVDALHSRPTTASISPTSFAATNFMAL